MPNLDRIKDIIEAVERERVERETVRRLGADASGRPFNRLLFPLTNLTAIAVLGFCSAITALALNFILVVWVFHLTFEK